jgi:hypothetical protein
VYLGAHLLSGSGKEGLHRSAKLCYRPHGKLLWYHEVW